MTTDNGHIMVLRFCLRLIAVVLLSLASISYSYSQDAQFTQFYANQLYLNPAFAGTARCPRFVLNYRNQWPSIPGNYITYAASYDQHIEGISGGLGFQAMHDRAGSGTLNTTQVSAMYSYQLPVNRKFSMRFGMQATFMQMGLNWDYLNFGDEIHPRYGFVLPTAEIPGPPNVYKPDFSAGVLGFSKDYYFGVAVHHLFEPRINFLGNDGTLYRKYTVHAGAVFPFDKRDPEDGGFSPNILFQSQGSFNQLNLGMYLRKGPLVGGLWGRLAGGTFDSFILLVGVQADKVRIGYSYDLTTSDLTLNSGGAHEVSMAVQLKCRVKRRRFRQLSCPQF